ncbi:MAG TPA: hypothetical protein VGQ44_10140 [Gemmatimonadaceae bacterium]|jgi:hypothetical protein|nr:hypothetical protein [Gemmatimonadaceae bacterium]
MPTLTRHRRRPTLTLVIALVALIAQVAVALSPLAEGRRPEMASHVESGGVKLHYAHNEATCASCQARSIHGTPRAADVGLRPSTEVSATVAEARVHVVAADRFSQDNPRAPPRLI